MRTKMHYMTGVLIIILAFTLFFGVLSNNVFEQSTEPSEVMTRSDSATTRKGMGSQGGSESAQVMESDPPVNVTVSCFDINSEPLYLANVVVLNTYSHSSIGSGFTNSSGVFEAINIPAGKIDVCVSWGNASAPGQPGYYMYFSGIDVTQNVAGVVNASDLYTGGSLARVTMTLQNSTGDPMLDTRLYIALNATDGVGFPLGMGPITDSGGVATLYLSNATWAPDPTYYSFAICQMTPSNNTLLLITDRLVTSDATVSLTMPNPSQMASIDLTFSSPTGISLMNDIRAYFEFSGMPPEVSRDDVAKMYLPSKLDGRMLFAVPLGSGGGALFLPVAEDGTTRLCTNASTPLMIAAIYTNTTNVSGGPWLYIPLMRFDSPPQGVVEHLYMGGAYLKLRSVTPKEAHLGSTPKLYANFTDEFYNPLMMIAGNGSTSAFTGMHGPLAYIPLYNLTIWRPDDSLWYAGRAMAQDQSGSGSNLNGILLGNFPSLDVLGTYSFNVSIDIGPWQLDPPGTTIDSLTGNFEVIEAQALATFSLNENLGVGTEGDTLPSGNYVAGVNFGMDIQNQYDDSHTTLGNLIFNATAENINGVNWQQYADWTSSYANWAFPPEFIIRENQGFGTGFGVNHSEAVQLNMTLARKVNQTTFDTDGYQLVNFTVTFTNTDFLWSGGNINANERWEVNASIVPGTFQTDAPLDGFNEWMHGVNFNFRKDWIQAGVTYNFSVIIKVKLTGNMAPPIIYKAGFGVGQAMSQKTADGGEGYTVEMPPDMLPNYVTSAQASTNTSNIWTLQSQKQLGANLNEFVTHVLDLSDFPRPFVENQALNHIVVIGETGPHGAFGIGAWTIDVYSATILAQALGTHATSGMPNCVMDTWIATYDANTGRTNVSNLNDNLIAIAGYAVNLITYEYCTDFMGAFSGPRTPLAPVYFHREWNPNPADVRTWIVFPGQPLTYSDWDIAAGSSDYCLIETIYDQQNSRCVLCVTSLTAQGTDAGCRVLAAKLMGQSLPFTIEGQAMLLRWEDGNMDGKVQLEEVSLVETYP